MSCQNDNYTVVVVQGDDTPIQVTLTDSSGAAVGTAIINKLYFSCGFENYQGQFTYSDGVWSLTIPKATTATFQATSPSGTNWDLTAVMQTGAVQTEIYRGTLVVCGKNNPIPTT